MSLPLFTYIYTKKSHLSFQPSKPTTTFIKTSVHIHNIMIIVHIRNKNECQHLPLNIHAHVSYYPYILFFSYTQIIIIITIISVFRKKEVKSTKRVMCVFRFFDISFTAHNFFAVAFSYKQFDAFVCMLHIVLADSRSNNK